MDYLLDVNVLIAWGWADHADHRRAVTWIGAVKAKRHGVLLATLDQGIPDAYLIPVPPI
jgi:predicted nucleic acid-binding protein